MSFLQVSALKRDKYFTGLLRSSSLGLLKKEKVKGRVQRREFSSDCTNSLLNYSKRLKRKEMLIKIKTMFNT